MLLMKARQGAQLRAHKLLRQHALAVAHHLQLARRGAGEQLAGAEPVHVDADQRVRVRQDAEPHGALVAAAAAKKAQLKRAAVRFQQVQAEHEEPLPRAGQLRQLHAAAVFGEHEDVAVLLRFDPQAALEQLGADGQCCHENLLL